ncbi:MULTISPECIES: recombinase family protein [Bacillus cereus group]|uniref:recombinase family protein n=1 Tax=Bacillus cereus group TaxID=86661 RepID=UPI001F59AA00|nr:MULTISPECIES: recombinase family protein [Bacillus cereus group]USL16737.1 recombinase family protein [Bacillus thuringiensis]
MYQEKVSGAQKNRQELQIALDMLREGDVFVVYKLDRLAAPLNIYTRSWISFVKKCSFYFS